MRWWWWAVLAGGGAALLIRDGGRVGGDGKPLTAVVLGSSDPTRQEYRVKGLLRLLQDRDLSRVIFAGKNEAPRMAELFHSQVAFLRLQSRIRPEPPIIVENSSTNTQTNIARVAELLVPEERVVIISDHDHVRGASYCLEQLGWETWYYIVPEPHSGYAAAAGYSMDVAWSDLPLPMLLKGPVQCESGYYFFCC